MRWKKNHPTRFTEAFLLILVFLASVLGFLLLAIGMQLQLGRNPWDELPGALLPPVVIGLCSACLHILLKRRGVQGEQLILPVITLLITIGFLMIWRLLGPTGVWQQLFRGYLPGMLIVAVLILYPFGVERIRQWAIFIVLVGLLLPIATTFFGVMDETGARLALKLGPLPAIQPSEIIKLILVIFLAGGAPRTGRAGPARHRSHGANSNSSDVIVPSQ